MKSQPSTVIIPEELIALEKEFAIPKKTPNPMKYFKGRKKDALKTKDSIDLKIIPCDSIETVWYRCKFGTEQPIKISKMDRIIDFENINSKKDINWPFLSCLNLTVLDLIVLAGFLELFAEVSQFLKNTRKICLHAFSCKCFNNAQFQEGA